jgi:hypothetical protein
VDWAEGPEPQGSAFLVGIINNVVPSAENPARFLIRISEYAEVDIPKVWGGWRNPVKYTDLGSLGIDPASLKFEPMPTPIREEAAHEALEASQGEGLTIAQAKRGLAKTFGVSETAVEITIHG